MSKHTAPVTREGMARELAALAGTTNPAPRH